MSRIGNSEHMIPAVQGSDIGDNDVINGTKMAQVGPDAYELSFMMPNGRELKSAPFNSDFRRKAMLAWVDAVRQNIVADAQEAAAAANRGALLPPIDSPAVPEVAEQRSADRVSRDTRIVGAASVDPTALVSAQFEAASAELVTAQADYAAALEKKTAAEAAVEQWRKLLAVLTPTSLPAQLPPAETMSDKSPLDALANAGRGHRKTARKPQRTLLAPSPTPPLLAVEATDTLLATPAHESHEPRPL
jgi:hypothetical protein